MTAHGTVEYETVECSSCGVEIRKDDASAFAVGDEFGSQYRSKIVVENYVTGWVCEQCRSAPVAFPDPSASGGVVHSIRGAVDRFLSGDYSMVTEAMFFYVVLSAILWVMVLLWMVLP
jgi:hypothetical protein